MLWPEAGRLGVSPSGDGSTLTADEQLPQGVPMSEMEPVQQFSGPVSPEGQAPLPGDDGAGLVSKVEDIVT